MTLAQRLSRASALALFLLGTAGLPGRGATASEIRTYPFHPGEKLHYSVYWAGIKAAEATLEIMPMASLDDTPAWHFVMTAQTTGIAAALYPLQSRTDSWAAGDMTRALRCTEHARKRFSQSTLSITFDWDAHTAHTVKEGKQRTVPLKPGSFDPLSIFYFFRMQELGEGVELSRPVADRKRCTTGVAYVRERQTVHSGGREWDAWLVEPDLRQIEGVYEKHPDARMQIWVSADERRIPVKVSSKVTLGSFSAELEGMEFPQKHHPARLDQDSPAPLDNHKGNKQP